MTDRVTELATLLRDHGPDAARSLIAAELKAAPPADRTTAEDGVMQMHGDRPDVDVIDD